MERAKLVNEGTSQQTVPHWTMGPRLMEVGVHEIQHVSPVEPKHSASSAARSIEREGRDACDDVAGAEEIRTTRIAEAGASRPGRSNPVVNAGSGTACKFLQARLVAARRSVRRQAPPRRGLTDLKSETIGSARLGIKLRRVLADPRAEAATSGGAIYFWLRADWDRARSGQRLESIPPLE